MIKLLKTADLSTVLALTGGLLLALQSHAKVPLQQLVAQANIVDMIQALDGNAYIVAADEQELGVISSDQYASESICNQYGSFGSPYSATSVWNRYGEYGSPYSNMSAYNPRANTPPLILFEGGAVFLSKNPKLPNRIDPGVLFGVLCK